MSNATRDNFKFTSVESCALFLEGLRALHAYEAETGKTSPSREQLKRLLDCADENLGDCVRLYPDDRISHFYYGIVLTIKNQDFYANEVHDRIDSLVAQGTLIFLREDLPKTWPGLDVERDTWPAGTEGPDGPRGEYLLIKQAAAAFANLVNQRWPLLEQAAAQFGFVQRMGPEELRNTAIYNFAQVLGRRGEADGFRTGLKALEDINLSPDRPKSGRSNDEIALELQIEILARHLRARLPINTKGLKADFDRAWESLEQMKDAIAASGLPTGYEIDLRADYLVKSGYVLYDQAIQGRFTDSAIGSLDAAAARFSDALEVRKSWNQAQLYLAITRAIQSGVAERQEFLSLVGLGPEPPVGSEALMQESILLFESLLGKAASAKPPESTPSEAEAFLTAARAMFQALQPKNQPAQAAESEEVQGAPPEDKRSGEQEANGQTS